MVTGQSSTVGMGVKDYYNNDMKGITMSEDCLVDKSQSPAKKDQ